MHRARPARKVLGLVVYCTVVFLVESPLFLALAGTLVAIGYITAGLQPRHVYQALRPALWLLSIIFVAQVFLMDVLFALFVVGRFAALIFAASLVTYTTTTSEFVDGIRVALNRTPSWVPKDKIALAISLCLRFIPLIRSVLEEVRQAQRARGLDRRPLALLVPLVIRTLKTADEVAEAIHARSFD